MSKNLHDYRIKQAVVDQRDPYMFEDYGVKPSTARNWIYRGFQTPIHCDDSCENIVAEALETRRIKELEERLAKAEALVELYQSVSDVCQISMYNKRVSDRAKRSKILDAVSVAAPKTGTKKALGFIGLSLSRYKRWKSPVARCDVSDSERCHKTYPNQLSSDEIDKMRLLVTSKKFAHITVKSLHYYAKRDGILHCCLDTWYKYIEKFNWERPFPKIVAKKHPGRVKRANSPNEIIHIDITHIKTTTGKTLYLQTVLDNYSRYILAWRISTKILKQNTVDLLVEAAQNAKEILPDSPICNLVSDGGSENINDLVKNLLDEKLQSWKHRAPKLHIRFSNNMLECWFRLLKSTYLRYQPSKTIKDLLRRLRFYIREYNTKIPLSSLGGRTPMEAYTGSITTECLKESFEQGSFEAKRSRLEDNLNIICAGSG